MITAFMQLLSPRAVNEDTILEIEFDDTEIVEGSFCQLQFEMKPLDGEDAIGVDWGDGTVQDWPRSEFRMNHSWTAPGLYTVRFDRRLKWFRFTGGYTVLGSRMAQARPLARILQWGDFVEDASGAFCNWTGTREGRGIQGKVPEWGKSIKDTSCCFQGCVLMTGGFPKWGPEVTDCAATYDTCRGLSGPLPPWPRNATDASQCFQATGATGKIPAWPAAMTAASRCYQNCTGLTGAWTEDPAALMPKNAATGSDAIVQHWDVVTGAGEALRALFDEDWGGTRDLE